MGRFRTMVSRLFWLPRLPLDTTLHTPPIWAAMLSGAGLGLAWGILARIWMRLISTSPEFTVAGTTGILVITTLFGIWSGLAFTARRRGWQRWQHFLPRGLAVAFFLPFGIAGGFPLMITVLIATLALTNKALVALWLVPIFALGIGLGDNSRPALIAVLVVDILLTLWFWLGSRWVVEPHVRSMSPWLKSIMTAFALGLAGYGIWSVASDVLVRKPGLFGILYVAYYLLLLYLASLALHIGLQPRESATARQHKSTDTS